jgi:hypothetical protein
LTYKTKRYSCSGASLVGLYPSHITGFSAEEIIMKKFLQRLGFAQSEPANHSMPLVEALEKRLCMSSTSVSDSTGIALADVVDMGGAGTKDLISTRFGHSGGLNIHFGDGSGHFGAPVFPFGYTFARGATVDIGDFNKDGFIDIVVFGGQGAGSGGLYVLLNKGNGTFDAPVQEGGAAFAGVSSGSLNEVKLAVGDINNDSDVDILVSDPALAYRRRTHSYSGSEIYVLYGNGNGTFQNGVPVSFTG